MFGSEYEAERMSGRVEEDAKGRARLNVCLTRTQCERLHLGCVEIVDIEVEVDLLRMFAARPHRRLVVGGELEGERGTAVAA